MGREGEGVVLHTREGLECCARPESKSSSNRQLTLGRELFLQGEGGHRRHSNTVSWRTECPRAVWLVETTHRHQRRGHNAKLHSQTRCRLERLHTPSVCARGFNVKRMIILVSDSAREGPESARAVLSQPSHAKRK